MERRQLIFGSMATVAASASLNHLGNLLGSGEAFASTNNDKLLATTAKCITAGLECINLCRKELAKGDKAMAECLGTVTDMLAACEALQKLAANESPHLAAMAKVCQKTLQDCAKSCEPHAKHMSECRACMEACRECEKACA